jgi:hypothetical protein
MGWLVMTSAMPMSPALPDRQLAMLEAALATASRRGGGREPVLVTQEELRLLLRAARTLSELRGEAR